MLMKEAPFWRDVGCFACNNQGQRQRLFMLWLRGQPELTPN